MNARYREIAVSAGAAAQQILVRFRLENVTRSAWWRDSGFLIGWQIFDPGAGTFIREGDWTRLPADVPAGQSVDVEIPVTLPAEDGPYRVYVSPIHEQDGWFYSNGTPFVLLDAHVAAGQVTVDRSEATTLSRLRWRNFFEDLPKVFRYPLRTVWANRRLIQSMVRRDVLARYRGSFGDVLWTVLNPLLLMSAYFFVFGVVLRTKFGADTSRTGFVLYFIAGMLPWLAFSEALGRSPLLVLEHRNFVKKLVFPLEILPVNVVISGFVTELFAMGIFLAGLLAARGGVPLTALWLPVLLIPQLLLTLGLCWFLAALGAFVRDLGQVMSFLLTLWFFLTPICYPETQLPASALAILGKNPVFTLVHDYRRILLEGQAPEWHSLWKLWAVALAACLGGHAWFYKLRKSFADVI